MKGLYFLPFTDFRDWTNSPTVRRLSVSSPSFSPTDLLSNSATYPGFPENVATLFFSSYAASLSEVFQPLDYIIISRVKSAWQTAIQLRQRAWVDNVRHRLGLGCKCTGSMSLLDAISFYRRPQCPSCKIKIEQHLYSAYDVLGYT